MEDKFKDLSGSLSDLMNLLIDFDKTRNDYKKPDIRANLVKMLSLGKIIGNTTQIHTEKLNSDIDEYLSNPSKQKFSSLIKDAINLQNNLWEL